MSEEQRLAYIIMVVLVAGGGLAFGLLLLRTWLIERRCPHPMERRRGIYGDEIIARRWKRAECMDCGKLFDELPESVQ